MEQKVIEGTWEEVARRAPELAGHRVRVTVLDDLAVPKAPNGAHADEATEATAFDVLSRAGLIGCLKGGAIDLATNPAHMEGFGGE
jgi:hypothetical protein